MLYILKPVIATLILSVTTGMKFWKVNSRKFYAVPDEDLLAPVRKKSRRSVSSIEDHDDHQSCNCADVLNDFSDEMALLHKKIDRVFELTKNTPVPLGLRGLLQDTLKCKICHISPMKPPIILAKCCRSILGCETCVNRWYEGSDVLTKLCPGCQGERGYAETIRLHGLDDLLSGIRDVIQ